MPPVVAIVGPTATGKSALALTLAESLGGEIVNADAMQVYRGFDIGTAKPTVEEQRRVRHHLIDILEPHEQYSAGEFARRARRAIADIEGRGALPLVVGGSGLYVRALLRGISPLPPADPEVRRRLAERLEAEGLDRLRRELAERDPVTEARLAAGDTQRVLRALEVVESSGRPLSEWIERRPFGSEPLPAVLVGLTLRRSILYDRVRHRVAGMVEAGWVNEVASLLRLGHDSSRPAFAAIGYRQIARHLRGEWSLEAALADTVRETRRFAKRQFTWFRREPDITWFSAVSATQDAGVIAGFVRARLGGS